MAPTYAGGTETLVVEAVYSADARYYLINGSIAPLLHFDNDTTYVFNQSDSSNKHHPLQLTGFVDSWPDNGVSYELDGAAVSETGYYDAIPYQSAVSRSVTVSPQNSPRTLHYACAIHPALIGNDILVSSFCDTSQLVRDHTYGVAETNCTSASVAAGTTCDFWLANHSGCGSAVCGASGVMLDAASTCVANPCEYVAPEFPLWPEELSSPDCAGTVAHNTSCSFELAGHSCTSSYQCEFGSWVGGVSCEPLQCEYTSNAQPSYLHDEQLWHLVSYANVSVLHDLNRTCELGSLVDSGTRCEHRIDGHTNCTSYTCTNGTWYSNSTAGAEDVGYCYALECPGSALLARSVLVDGENHTVGSSCSSSGSFAHGHECLAQAEGLACDGHQVCLFGDWYWSDDVHMAGVTTEVSCSAQTCFYNSSVFNPFNYSNNGCSGDMPHGAECSVWREGYLCSPSESVECDFGVWKTVGSSTPDTRTRDCSTPLKCDFEELSVGSDPYGERGVESGCWSSQLFANQTGAVARAHSLLMMVCRKLDGALGHLRVRHRALQLHRAPV